MNLDGSAATQTPPPCAAAPTQSFRVPSRTMQVGALRRCAGEESSLGILGCSLRAYSKLLPVPATAAG